jgi:predicted PolB exonuclease-like 3'-5' exonuclease
MTSEPTESVGQTAREPAPAPPRFLVLDTESVPDGKLIAQVKYPGENLTPEQAVTKAQAEARAKSPTGSDFLPVTFQYPVAVCILRVDPSYGIQTLSCLDAPQFRPARIVQDFWKGAEHYARNSRLVTFNGRGFDLPLLELAAFRFGCAAHDYFQLARKRFDGTHIDVMDWLTNFGACRLEGGLNLLSKLLGKPGKMETTGNHVYDMFLQQRFQEINDYCMFDTIDTYFVFLRTRVMIGEITLTQEQQLVASAKQWLTAKAAELPALQKYLACWGDWIAWP